MRTNPDCNRVDLDDEGDETDTDYSECINTFGLEGGDDNED
jgi:hypothetical protein